MQQAVDYLLKVRSQLSSLVASYNFTSHAVGTAEDSCIIRHRLIQQRGALMTGLITVQENFIVVIEAQRRRTSGEQTLFQLCDYYLSFLEYVLKCFERGERLLRTYPDVPKREMGKGMLMEPVSSNSTMTSDTMVRVNEKERAELKTDITSVKLFRNTVKLLRNRLRTGNAIANRVPRLLPIVQAIISKHRATREYQNSSTSESNLYDTPSSSETGAMEETRFKILWFQVENKKLLTFSVIIAAGVVLASVLVVSFVFASIDSERNAM